MRSKTTFIVTFLVIIFLPALFFDYKTTYSQRENRILATPPKIINDANINTEFPIEMEKYVQDRFGLRSNLLRLNHKINKKAATKRVIAGKEGWLFHVDSQDGNNLKDFLKSNLVTASEAQNFARSIKDRADWCERNGIKFVFMIVPNKHTIYPELYPFMRPEGISRTDQFVRALNDLDVEYIDLRNILLNSKSEYNIPLYHRLGTHWNDLGAYVAYKKALLPYIQKALNRQDIGKLQFEYQIQYDGLGDRAALRIMNTVDEKTEKQPVVTFSPKGHNWGDLYVERWSSAYNVPYKKDIDLGGVSAGHGETVNYDNQLPKAIIFRDSFFVNMVPFTSSIFSNAQYEWKSFDDEDKEAILKNKPDIIIFERVERYLPNIMEKKFTAI